MSTLQILKSETAAEMAGSIIEFGEFVETVGSIIEIEKSADYGDFIKRMISPIRVYLT